MSSDFVSPSVPHQATLEQHNLAREYVTPVQAPLPRRTWPYGLQLHVQVIGRDVTSGGIPVVTAVDKHQEAHVLAGCGDAQVGQVVTIEFTQGGPTGGYWKIIEGENRGSEKDQAEQAPQA